jgi:hypothetical protein
LFEAINELHSIILVMEEKNANLISRIEALENRNS